MPAHLILPIAIIVPIALFLGLGAIAGDTESAVALGLLLLISVSAWFSSPAGA